MEETSASTVTTRRSLSRTEPAKGSRAFTAGGVSAQNPFFSNPLGLCDSGGHTSYGLSMPKYVAASAGKGPCARLESLSQLPDSWWNLVPNDRGGYNYRTTTHIAAVPVEILCDGGAGANSVTEEIVIGAINHSHSKGIYSKDPRYPVVQLERWEHAERVTGIASGHHVQIIGAVVLRVQMTELGKQTGPIIWVRCKIFKAGQSDWHGLILGGRALDSPMAGGLGHRPTPKGHAFEALGILMSREEDIKANRYPDDEAYRMQVEIEPAPGVFAGEVRPSLLDIDTP